MLSSLFDVVQIRSLFLRSNLDALAGILTAATVFKLGLLCLEVQSKRSYLKLPYRDYPPETLVSILNRGSFWWLNQIFFAGWKTGLNTESLTEIDISLKSAVVQAQILSAWRIGECSTDFLISPPL